MAANAKSTKKSRSTKTTAQPTAGDQQVLHVGMSEAAVIGSDPAGASVVVEDPAGDGLDALLRDLDAPTEIADAPITSDVVLEEATIDIAEPTLTEETLEAAVVSAEATEAALSVATPEGVVEAGAVPTGTTSDIAPEAPAATEAAKPKRVPVPRKFYSNKADRLVDRMGDSLVEYTVLTMEDAGVSDDELKAKMAETLAIIRDMSKKKQNRASMFIEFIAGKKSKPNAILDCTLKVLAKDGAITTGNEGNVFNALVKEHSYDKASARAMGGNTISMLADLKVLIEDGKQKFVANPASLLLMKANSLIFGEPVEAAPAAA